ncbi:endonuclease/exonuclease/phosphatase family protein [Jannaschia donghaensis]|uniref:Endonuclease/exonuclease/phosphatase domain-containing protein n=1 Tax=Jannaschia donghaensis TaxID=420998 RepID=A0A0M6YGT9_9RHOB|nr:endonuclease/exonuclease/phosphatase family protein [Jannaschia donghaensis]CTQ49144.1 hypothetical protein JDO7802_01155 [Jannaschia donghaensis]
MAPAETIRLATFDTGLGRKGPGLMLRDLQSGRDDQAEAAIALIAQADADVLMLMDIDWDYAGNGAAALRDRLSDVGGGYPHHIARRPNSGVPSGFDLDGDGTTHEARDALGYGRFTGDSGLAVLSRFPLGEIRDLTGALWSDHGTPADLVPPPALAGMPLATTAQWVVPITIRGQEITLVTMSAGTPVFDGPEDRNGIRNRDELTLVSDLVDGAKAALVMGRANQDPAGGEGHAEALMRLLTHPALQDPRPEGPDGGLATVEFRTVGPMRVDYVLPPRGLRVVGSGTLHDAAAGPSRLVWVDVAVP